MIKKQAIQLAMDNKKGEPGIEEFYWIPDSKEIRLIEVESNIAKSLSGSVEPFYFNASPQDGFPTPSGIAMVRPDEVGKLNMPEGWGNWENAEKLEIGI